MGETTPFVFGNRLYRVENWQKYFDLPGSAPGERFMEDQVRIWDIDSNQVVSVPFIAHSFGMAYCHDGRVHVFATRHETDRPWRHFRAIDMTSSSDLVHWTAPVTVIEAENDEHLFNTAVCHDGTRFVLLYETDDRRWPAFTFKYAESENLIHWRLIPDAVYGREKYVGGPALYVEGGWFYTLYLQDLGGYSGGTWETRVTRSRDLRHWEDAPVERPFLAPDTSRVFTYNHFGRQVEVREINASDAELCFWQGSTLVYFNGGDQQTCGDLQQAEFKGTPRELLERFYEEPVVSVPSPRQLAIQERALGAFIHFGLATWYEGPDKAVFPDLLKSPYCFNMGNWGSMVAQPPGSVFHPAGLDAEQWVLAALAMGAKLVVLTAKHHNGFCLWPTRATGYSVRGSPWRGGQGDVVREFVVAARKHGLGVGLYFSAGDVNAGCFSTPEPQGQRKLVGDLARYFPIAREQLHELLSGYGPLDELWFDGALDPFGLDVLQSDGTPVGSRYWDELTELVRRLQPGAVIMGGSHPDLRWPGNEEGVAPYPLSYVVEKGQEQANWIPPGTTGWVVPEADVFTRPTWFWTPDSDGALLGTARLMDIYSRSIGHGSNLLINMTPDRRGLIPEVETARLAEFGDALRRRYGSPLAETRSEGRWGEGMSLDLELGRIADVEWVILEEDIRRGQRLQRYRLEARGRAGDWSVVAEGRTVGRMRIVNLPSPVETEAIRLRVLETTPLPVIRRMSAG
jgi:alpha-L-fucosidase